jgi:hypothetical protein
LYPLAIHLHFVGQKLPFPVVNFIANRIWASLGLLKVLSSDNGFFLFTFDLVDHAVTILDWALYGTWLTEIWCLNVGNQTFDYPKIICPEFRFRLSFIMFRWNIGLTRG